MAHNKLSVLEPNGYVVLRDSELEIPEEEFLGLEYMDWKSGGDTNFAPIASAEGDLECAGFWDHGKADKDGVWTANAKICPTLVNYVEQVGANYGRVRTIKLNPQNYEQALKQIHVDDNNRLNPDGEGWVVRTWLELSDNPGAAMILRHDKDDPSTEVQIPLHRGMRYVVDSERMYHIVMNPTDEPRYALITSFESGPALDRWIQSQLP
ncbi:MAG: hypothetical protein ACOYN3_01485 [Acidimicrobiia bacterium]